MSRQIRNVICFALPITIGNVRIDFFQIDKEFTLRINLLLPPLSIKEMHRTLKINFISLSKSFEILSKYFWTKNFNLYRDLFPKERERKGGEETRDSINFHSFRNSSKKIDTVFPNDISSNDRPKFNLFFQKSKWEEEKRSNAVIAETRVSGSLRRTSLPSKKRFNRWEGEIWLDDCLICTLAPVATNFRRNENATKSRWWCALHPSFLSISVSRAEDRVKRIVDRRRTNSIGSATS